MTENTTEATVPTTTTARPVRVPNVSPGARSGMDHEVIGSLAIEAHDAQHGTPEPEDDLGDDDNQGTPFDPTDPEDVREWVTSTRTAVVEYAVASLDPETDADLVAELEALDTVPDAAPADPLPVSPAPEGSDPTNGALPTGEQHQAPVIPEDVPDTRDGLLEWVHADDTEDGLYDRAVVVLERERQRDPEHQRSTLVEPLEKIVAEHEAAPAGD